MMNRAKFLAEVQIHPGVSVHCIARSLTRSLLHASSHAMMAGCLSVLGRMIPAAALAIAAETVRKRKKEVKQLKKRSFLIGFSTMYKLRQYRGTVKLFSLLNRFLTETHSAAGRLALLGDPAIVAVRADI